MRKVYQSSIACQASLGATVCSIRGRFPVDTRIPFDNPGHSYRAILQVLEGYFAIKDRHQHLSLQDLVWVDFQDVLA